MINDEADVEFRYGGIDTGNGEFGMVVLGYGDRASALRFYHLIHEYISAPGGTPRSFDIRLDLEDEGSYRLQLTLQVDERGREIVIPSIDADHVARLRRSLSEFPYFMVAAGYYEDGDFKLLPLMEFNFFRAQITIDDQVVEGRVRPGFDPYELIGRVGG